MKILLRNGLKIYTKQQLLCFWFRSTWCFHWRSCKITFPFAWCHWGPLCGWSSRESEPGQGGCAEGKAARSVLGMKHNLGQTNSHRRASSKGIVTNGLIDQPKSKVEVECAKNVHSENLDLYLTHGGASDVSRLHLLCTWCGPDTIPSNSFAHFNSILNIPVDQAFQNEDAKDPKRSFLPKVQLLSKRSRISIFISMYLSTIQWSSLETAT